jgi:serine/threonine-protein kinase RsbT
VWVHGGGGIARVEQLANATRVGVRVCLSDKGPGIPDIEKVLRGGYSTAKSMGLGVSGSRRLVDDFEIKSEPGEGTTVTITKWAKFT